MQLSLLKKLSIIAVVILGVFFSSLVVAANHKKHKHILSYVESGNGTPLVLIHAFPADKQMWQPQLDNLNQYFHVISVDLPGFGSSEPTNGEAVTMTEDAQLIKALLDNLGIKKAIIGGESMGGYVALAFLQQYPDATEGLILSDTRSIADSEQAKKDREKLAQDVLYHGTTKFVSDFMTKALSPQADNDTRVFLLSILQQQAATGVASALRGMALREDTSDVLKATDIPVLIITGDQDAVISPEESRNMHALAQNSKLVEIPHAGHLSNLEQPDLWNKAVMDTFNPSVVIK